MKTHSRPKFLSFISCIRPVTAATIGSISMKICDCECLH